MTFLATKGTSFLRYRLCLTWLIWLVEVLFFSLLCVVRLFLVGWPALLIVVFAVFIVLCGLTLTTLKGMLCLLGCVEQNLEVWVAAWHYTENSAFMVVIGEHWSHFWLNLRRSHREFESFGSLAAF